MCTRFEIKTILSLVDCGTIHPGTHGLLRFTLSLSDELICGSDLDLGYLHRGTEKLMESKHLYQSIGYASRLDYVGGSGWDHLLCNTLEDLVGCLLPVRALSLRLVLVELHRIMNHILAVGCAVGDLGDVGDILRLLDVRESLLTLASEWTGSRLHHHMIVPGGLALDPDCSPTNSWDGLVKWLFEVGLHITEMSEWKETMMARGAVGMRLLNAMPVRTVYGDNRLAANDLLSGVMLRAAGVPYDVRIQLGYGYWKEIGDMTMYYAMGGTAYDRLLLRCDEITFSFHAMNSVGVTRLDGAHGEAQGFSFDGLLMVDAEDMSSTITSYCNMEGPYEVRGVVVCVNELYKGEGIIFMQQGNKGRYHLMGPSIRHLEYFDQVVRYSSLSMSDLMSWLGSVDVVVGEMDK